MSEFTQNLYTSFGIKEKQMYERILHVFVKNVFNTLNNIVCKKYKKKFDGNNSNNNNDKKCDIRFTGRPPHKESYFTNRLFCRIDSQSDVENKIDSK